MHRLAFLVLMNFAVLCPASAPPPPLRPLTAAQRTALDALARKQPAETIERKQIDLAGNLPAWLLSQVRLPASEELRHARRIDAEIRKQFKTFPVTPAAQKCFDRLVRELPAHLKPREFRYRLAVVDRNDLVAFTPGGGLVFISRPLLRLLLADPERGPAALAFILGRELGHIGLEHCRRGWQRLAVEEEFKNGVEKNTTPGWVRDVLETGVTQTGKLVQFLYTREQEFDADLFALSLCRNTGFNENETLDALRLLTMQCHPEAGAGRVKKKLNSTLGYYLTECPDPLCRLRRLLMECAGEVDSPEDFGLFRYDPATEKLTRCKDRAIGGKERAIVFVHGMHGGRKSFVDYLTYFSQRRELRSRPLLVFIYPANGSLARAGQLLTREIKRVVAAPEKTVFIAHSAGGLVFRWYAEKRQGQFARACILATPHAGSDLTNLKFLVDLSMFARGLGGGLTKAVSEAVNGGSGEMTYDLHPDSLFLRHLGQNDELTSRYYLYYGEYVTGAKILALHAGFILAKKLILLQTEHFISEGTTRTLVIAGLKKIALPNEVKRGDLIVTSRSAILKGNKRVTITSLHHLAFLHDPDFMREMVRVLLQSQ